MHNREPVKYLYSRGNSALYTIAFGGFTIYLGTNVFGLIQKGDLKGGLLFGAVALCFLAMFLTIFIKYALPALQGKTALDITQGGLTDHINNITVDWDDVQNIELRRSRRSSALYLTLRTEPADSLRISLKWVEGNDQKILEKAIALYNEY